MKVVQWLQGSVSGQGNGALLEFGNVMSYGIVLKTSP